MTKKKQSPSNLRIWFYKLNTFPIPGNDTHHNYSSPQRQLENHKFYRLPTVYKTKSLGMKSNKALTLLIFNAGNVSASVFAK